MSELTIVKSENLPVIPGNWDYDSSVTYLKPKIENWKQETYEVACELYIANEILSTGGRPKKSVPNGTDFRSYCDEVGIPKTTAYRWMASVFGPKRLPSPNLPKLESQVIYADPPWAFDNSGFNQSAAQQYETLKPERICNYTDETGRQIKQLAKQKGSVLFLWVPASIVPEGLDVLKSWGFDYKSQLVWKKDKAPGIGWFVNSKHELLFIGVNESKLHPVIKYDSVFEAPVTEHSKKPEIVYEMIENMYTGPYIELFARNTRKGWQSWGNELANS